MLQGRDKKRLYTYPLFAFLFAFFGGLPPQNRNEDLVSRFQFLVLVGLVAAVVAFVVAYVRTLSTRKDTRIDLPPDGSAASLAFMVFLIVGLPMKLFFIGLVGLVGFGSAMLMVRGGGSTK